MVPGGRGSRSACAGGRAGIRYAAQPLGLVGIADLRSPLARGLAIAAAFALAGVVLLARLVAGVPLRTRIGALALAVAAGVAAAAGTLGWIGGGDALPHARPLELGPDAVPLVAAIAALALAAGALARSALLRRAPLVLAPAALAGALALSAAALSSLGAWHAALDRAGGAGRGDRTVSVVMLDERRYPEGRARARFIAALDRRLRAEPAFERAALGTSGPLGNVSLMYGIDAHRRGGPRAVDAAYLAAAPGFVDLVGMKIVRGRDVRASDDAGHERVALVDASFARAYFGAADPLGRTVALDQRRTGERLRIVGLLAPVRLHDLDRAPGPVLVEALAQRPWPFLSVAVASSLGEAGAAAAVDRTLASLDPHVTSVETRTAAHVVADATAQPRYLALLTTAGALLAWALALAAIAGLPLRRLARPRAVHRST